METPLTQEEHLRRYGYYSRTLPIPTKEEALQHAVNQINRAFGRK